MERVKYTFDVDDGLTVETFYESDEGAQKPICLCVFHVEFCPIHKEHTVNQIYNTLIVEIGVRAFDCMTMRDAWLNLVESGAYMWPHR